MKDLFSLQFPGYPFVSSAWMEFYSSLSYIHKKVSFMIVRWCRPLLGVFKLNTDGCSRGNPGRAGGGGGILRDDGGNFLLAFSSFFGNVTSIQAEALALLFGVKSCLSRDYVNLHIEMDLLVLVHILKQGSSCPWSIYTEVKYLLKFSSNFVAISHCFRESNQVADSLANMGCDQGFNTTYHQLVDLPMKARGAFRLDRIGLPSIRKCVQRG